MRFSLRARLGTLFAVSSIVVGCSQGGGGTNSGASALPPTILQTTVPSSMTSAEVAAALRTAAVNPAVVAGAQVLVKPLNLVKLNPVPNEPGEFYTLEGGVIGSSDGGPARVSDMSTPYATPTCSAPGMKWSGNIPPSCTNTGAFRRIYSASAVAGAVFGGFLPQSTPPAMPTGRSPPDGTTGFVYLETWSMPYTSAVDTEAGFQYSATSNWYTFYAKTTDGNNNAVFYEDTRHEQSNDQFSLGVQAYNAGNPVLPTPMPTGTPVNLPCSTYGCVIVSFSAICGSMACSYSANISDLHYNANNGNSMIAATMTTIGQTLKANNYSDGFRFGPNQITSSQTEHYTANGLTVDSQWATGGTQSWPADATRIMVVPQQGSGTNAINETDTINLYHLLNSGLR